MMVFGKLKQTGFAWLVLSVAVLILDQWTKIWATDVLATGRVIEVMPHFDFRYAVNYGAAFSFLADAGGWQRYGLSIFAVVIGIVLVVWLCRNDRSLKWLNTGLALVIAGAFGNAIDRIQFGYVVDFIDWYAYGYHWPTFNVADIAISIGAAMLIIDSIWFEPKRLKSENLKSKSSV